MSSGNRTPLPWGHWLRVESLPGSVSYVDTDGRRWPSVREAFWYGRLNMAGDNPSVREEQLELMLAVLAAKERPQRLRVEDTHDLFEGNLRLHRLYLNWLQSLGLIGGGLRDEAFDGYTTQEGSAVLAMLLATRSAKAHGVPIGAESIRLSAGAPPAGDRVDEERLAAFEQAAKERLSAAFVRGKIGRVPVIALHRRDDEGLMPLVRTVWSVGLADESSRDALYRWLVDRIDRWDEWTALTWRSGGAALTQHLLALLAADLDRKGAVRPEVIALPGPA